MSPTCDETVSDGEEPDDFVRRQLLLSTVLADYFGVSHGDCRTFFRDDLLGLGLFMARGGKLMQAVCGRTHPRSQWRLIDLRPGPGWSSYKAEQPDLGVQVTALAANSARRTPPDPGTYAVMNGQRYAIKWDVPRVDVEPEE